MVQALLAARADRTVTDKQLRSVLMGAVVGGNAGVVKALLSSGVAIEAVDAEGDTALFYAAAYGFLDIGEILVTAGARKGREELLVVAARQGDIRLVRALLGLGMSADTKANRDMTPLFAAASEGQTAIVEFLLTAGANVNVKNSEGETPLMAAASSGDQELVSRLIQKGADVDTITIRATAGHHATRRGHADVARLLQGSSPRD